MRPKGERACEKRSLQMGQAKKLFACCSYVVVGVLQKEMLVPAVEAFEEEVRMRTGPD